MQVYIKNLWQGRSDVLIQDIRLFITLLTLGTLYAGSETKTTGVGATITCDDGPYTNPNSWFTGSDNVNIGPVSSTFPIAHVPILITKQNAVAGKTCRTKVFVQWTLSEEVDLDIKGKVSSPNTTMWKQAPPNHFEPTTTIQAVGVIDRQTQWAGGVVLLQLDSGSVKAALKQGRNAISKHKISAITVSYASGE